MALISARTEVAMRCVGIVEQLETAGIGEAESTTAAPASARGCAMIVSQLSPLRAYDKLGDRLRVYAMTGKLTAASIRQLIYLRSVGWRSWLTMGTASAVDIETAWPRG